MFQVSYLVLRNDMSPQGIYNNQSEGSDRNQHFVDPLSLLQIEMKHSINEKLFFVYKNLTF